MAPFLRTAGIPVSPRVFRCPSDSLLASVSPTKVIPPHFQRYATLAASQTLSNAEAKWARSDTLGHLFRACVRRLPTVQQTSVVASQQHGQSAPMKTSPTKLATVHALPSKIASCKRHDNCPDGCPPVTCKGDSGPPRDTECYPRLASGFPEHNALSRMRR